MYLIRAADETEDGGGPGGSEGETEMRTTLFMVGNRVIISFINL